MATDPLHLTFTACTLSGLMSGYLYITDLDTVPATAGGAVL